MSDAEEVIDVLNRGGNTVTLLDIQEFQTFQTTLEDKILDPASSNVLVLASSENILAVFQKVAEFNVESVRLYWFIYNAQEVMEPLAAVLREGSQVFLANMKDQSTIEFFASQPSQNNKISLESVGHGKLEQKDTLNSSYLSVTIFDPPLIKTADEIYSSFNGRELVVSANNDWPFFGQIILENGTVLPDAGIDINVLNALGDALNFTYKVMPPPDGQWGGPQPDGTISGLIGMVARRDAHIAIDEITITSVRETVVDFSYPYMQDSTLIISPSPKPTSRALAILSPFAYEVWGTLIAALLGMSVVLVGISALSTNSLERRWMFLETLFNTFRSLVIQGSKLITKRSVPRFILAIWFLFCVVISALYGSTLTAILAVPSFEKPIDSLLDALRATNKGYRFGTLGGTVLVQLFKESTYGTYMELGEKIEESDLQTSIRGGFEKILVMKYIFIMSGLQSKFTIIELGESNFYIAKEEIFPQNYGIALPRGAPYANIFNRIIMKLTESGLIGKWVQTELQKMQVLQRKSRLTNPQTVSFRERGPGALTLGHLQGAFILIGIGYSVALVALLVEKALSKLT